VKRERRPLTPAERAKELRQQAEKVRCRIEEWESELAQAHRSVAGVEAQEVINSRPALIHAAEIKVAELELQALDYEMAAAEEQRAPLVAREAQAKEKYEQAKADYRRALAAYRTLIYATMPDIRADIDATQKRLTKLKREGPKGSEGPARNAPGRAPGRPGVVTANLKQKRRGR
jgi:chromosome segregation ATPase